MTVPNMIPMWIFLSVCTDVTSSAQPVFDVTILYSCKKIEDVCQLTTRR